MSSSRPPLHVAESIDEKFEELARRWDLDLRNRLVEEHLPLAEYHCRRFSNAGIPRDDLRQVAHMAIIGAVDRFEPGRGVAFSTFASRTVEGECQRYLRDRTWAVRPPRRLQETFLALRKVQAEMTHESGRAPTARELADRLGRSEETVLAALEAGNARWFVDATPANEPDAEQRAARAPVETRSVELDRDGTPFEAVDLRLTLAGVVEELDERDRTIIELRFTHGWTERQMAEHLGISQSYLSRCLRRVLRDLRRRLDEQAD